MRPAGSTAVASRTNTPAPDSDSEPRCWRCQSVAEPSTALYWHIGETAMRFARVTPPSVIGANKGEAVIECLSQDQDRTSIRSRPPQGSHRSAPRRHAFDDFDHGYSPGLLKLAVSPLTSWWLTCRAVRSRSHWKTT